MDLAPVGLAHPAMAAPPAQADALAKIAPVPLAELNSAGASGLFAWLAVAIGGMAYGGGLLVTGALRGDDMAAVLRSLPVGPLRRLLPSAG